MSLLSCFVFKEGGDKDRSAAVRDNMQVWLPLDIQLTVATDCDSRAQVPLRQLQAIARSVARFDFPLCLYSFISIFSCLRPSCS